MKRGFYGIIIVEPKFDENIGTVLRSAHAFNAAFVGIVGARYSGQPSDTSKAGRHLPIFHWPDLKSCLSSLPKDAEKICVEVNGSPIGNFVHPDSAIYFIGGEDRTLDERDFERFIGIETPLCLNLAVAASIVMFHRSL